MSESGNSAASPSIRVARTEDAAQIARLATDLGYPATTVELASRLEIMLPHPNYFIVVAEDGDSLIGCAAAEARQLLVLGAKAELTALIVSSSARHLGVGKALVRAAELWAVARRLDTIVVRSNVARAESHPFYERIGYARHKTQHVYIRALPTADQKTGAVPQGHT